MSVFRIDLVVQEIDTDRAAIGEPIQTEVGLISAPSYDQMKGLMAEMLVSLAEEFRDYDEEGGDRG